MKYYVDFQHLPKGAARPIDDGEIVAIEASSDDGSIVLPNVGDFVFIDNSADGGQRSSFSGKVRTRLFRYMRVKADEIHCAVNIVVEDTDDDWGKLVKE